MQGGDLYDLQYCWDSNISVVFPTLGLHVAKIIDYIIQSLNGTDYQLPKFGGLQVWVQTYSKFSTPWYRNFVNFPKFEWHRLPITQIWKVPSLSSDIFKIFNTIPKFEGFQVWVKTFSKFSTPWYGNFWNFPKFEWRWLPITQIWRVPSLS